MFAVLQIHFRSACAFRYFGLAPSLAAALVIAGCHKGDSVVGTWRCTAANVGTNSVMTFNSDHTVSFTATNGPHQAAFKLTGIGTWSATGKELTIVPLSMTLGDMDPKERLKLTPFLNRQIDVAQTGAIEWKTSDEFILYKSGVAQDFKRIP